MKTLPIVLLALVNAACTYAALEGPPHEEIPVQDPAPVQDTQDPRLYVDMLTAPALPKQAPAPNMCPFPGGACMVPSPYHQTCINENAYWLCVDDHWEDRGCEAYPSAICNANTCVGPKVSPCN